MKKKTRAKTRILLYDTTLRDGTQGEGVSLSVEDKVRIARTADRLGVSYIEGGWPGSNPKDEEFFARARGLGLKNAKLSAFSSTRRRDKKAHEDPFLAALLRVKTPVACIFGKSWDFHVTHALHATPEENLAMIADSVRFLKSKGKEVIYDAEHFFDGYRANPSYALATLKAALAAGADNLTLCDTNGGSLPHQVGEIIRTVREAFPDAPLGIHTHNDSGCAVANSLEAVREGCVLVQGTLNGLGERCGNADLVAIIPGIKLKLGLACVSDEQMRFLTEASRYVYETANMVPRDHQPYVGMSAFAHKGGIHVSAVQRHAATYEHLSPESVGNKRRVLVSELAGRSNILAKGKEFHLDFHRHPEGVDRVVRRVKDMENRGYQFEGADASFVLLVERELRPYKPFFDLKTFRVIVEEDKEKGGLTAEATLKVEVEGRAEHTVAEGNGPVDALDRALRLALAPFYPSVTDLTLADFKVRVVNAAAGTAAKVRVLIETRDHKESWGTVGVSENIIEASWIALKDAVEYKLLKDKRR